MKIVNSLIWYLIKIKLMIEKNGIFKLNMFKIFKFLNNLMS